MKRTDRIIGQEIRRPLLAIVHHDNFLIAVTQLDQTIQAFTKLCVRVPVGNDYGNRSIGHFLFFWSFSRLARMLQSNSSSNAPASLSVTSGLAEFPFSSYDVSMLET